MLDLETRRRIDTARDILVGKVPDPKSQVEQITFALIYKFMDDMDALSEEMDGERSFFTGEFARYRWPVLLHSGLGGHETLNRYVEAIERMPQNPKIPALFRSIFNNAYLPYRDPPTLRDFLHIIDHFQYDHSERLGDAYEYLLSIMGTQKEAGQIRTPRHLIDFIVSIIDPKKHETVLDPACGTAGFLVSAWKHMQAAATGEDGTGTLTPDERKRIAANFTGYDIWPDWVRLSLVNLYLHDFMDPHVYEYDTLTSEERWNEHADVILANPPFMTPKGGIRPHDRFSIASRRSEVLFVDYIAEHLTHAGRAGVIVPEGVIFQNQKAYRQLRRMLLEECLVAVVSLPAGVFKPYSGVKTSILLLDRALARRADGVAFLRIANDGFELSDQRRPVEGGQLGQARAEIVDYLRRLRTGESVEGWESALGMVVPRERIATDGNCDLNGERYRDTSTGTSDWPMVPLGELGEFQSGGTPPKRNHEYWDGDIPFVTAADLQALTVDRSCARSFLTREGYLSGKTPQVHSNDVLIGTRTRVGLVSVATEDMGASQDITVFNCGTDLDHDYLARILLSRADYLDSASNGATIQGITRKFLAGVPIPLPPLDVQREIMAEIEGYQRVIDGARAVVAHYRPHIPIDPSWPLAALGDASLFRVESGGTPRSGVDEYWNGDVYWATLVDLPQQDFITEINETQRTISETGLKESSAKLIPENSVVVSTRATIGRIAINRVPLATNQGFKNIVVTDSNRAVPEYVALALTKQVSTMEAWASGGTFKELSKSRFCELNIPLPSLETQRAIVAELEAERALVEANRELIARMDGKIAGAVARVWGGGAEDAS